MTNNLPPLDNDSLNEDTIMSGRTQAFDTRPNTPTRAIPPAKPQPSGSHVEPIKGQKARPAPTQQPAGYPARPTRRAKKSNQDSGFYLPWWSIALTLIGVVVIAFGVVGGVYVLGNMGGLLTEPTPIIRIITAVPTDMPLAVQPTANIPSTQVIIGGTPAGSLSLAGPTLEAVQFTPTPPPISLGSAVRVDGVDEQKLNVRDVASVTNSTVVFRADEDEQFTIVEGPVQGDGFTWWRIQDPANPARVGWAVSNYLAVIGQ